MTEQLTIPEIAAWAEAQLAVMQCYTRFTTEDLIDIRNCAIERGIPMGQLMHEAVMESLFR